MSINLILKTTSIPTTTTNVITTGTIPQSISGLQLWLDAKDSSTLVLNGTSLTSWNDKSGNNRSATKYDSSPTNAIYQPNGFNNLPAIYIEKDQGLSVDIPSGTFTNCSFSKKWGCTSF